MNNKTNTTNIAFIILIFLLIIAALKAQNTPTTLAGMFDFGGMSGISASESKSKSDDDEPQVVLRDFSEIQQPKKVNRVIDKATAMSYMQVRSLNGTELLALSKVKKISPYLDRNKKVVIYINKGSEKHEQAFMKEFAKSRAKYSSNPNFVFIPLETLWDLNDDNIKNTHDRVVYNLKQDCGQFCILDLSGEKLITLKGSQVSKKSAEIVGVILNSL